MIVGLVLVALGAGFLCGLLALALGAHIGLAAIAVITGATVTILVIAPKEERPYTSAPIYGSDLQWFRMLSELEGISLPELLHRAVTLYLREHKDRINEAIWNDLPDDIRYRLRR
jgi:hypothetical protein